MEEDSIIYVDADATDGEETGESWADAYTDLQDALEVAGASDQIWVAEGTYVPTSTIDREISFVINNGVQVYGGFVGNEVALSQRDIVENETILSGNIGADTQADNSYHIINIDGSPSGTLIDGFTISEGQADFELFSSAAFDNGGAIVAVNSASATLSNLIIEDNFAVDNGGAVYIGGGSDLAIDSVVFSNNSSSANGGAIYIGGGSSFELLNSLFVENQALDGGGIFTSVDTLNLIGNTFYGNDAGANSDDIRDSSGSFSNNRTITNNIFADGERIDSLKFFFDFGEDAEAINVSNNILTGTGQFSRFGATDIIELGDDAAEDNIFDEEPIFADVDEGDFRLRLNSPGVDEGNEDFLVDEDTDLVGNPRIYGDTVDIGAYEYGLYLDIEDARLLEGDEENRRMRFNVTLSDSLDLAPNDEVTVRYTTVDRNAKDEQDYTGVDGTLTFDAETDTLPIFVPIIGDTRPEVSENFFVNLSGATGGAVINDGQAQGTIVNDDQLPVGVESDRFFAPDVDASFYTPTAAERADILAIIPELELAGADGLAFLFEPGAS